MSTVLHLPFDTESAICVPIDHGPYRFSAQMNGTAGLSAAQKKYGNTALALGTSTINNVLFSASDAFAITGGPFTIAFNVYMTAYNSSLGHILGVGSQNVYNGTNGIHWVIQSTLTGIRLVWYNGSSFASLGAAVPLSAWKHIEFDYDGTTLYMFVEGVLANSVNNPTLVVPSTTPPLCVGSVNNLSITSSFFSGYIDDLLIDKGTALHTTSFTPSQVAYTPITPALDKIGTAPSTSAYPVPQPSLDKIGTAPSTSAYPVPQPSLGKLIGIPLCKDIYSGGKGKIVGTTKVKGAPDVPVARRVVLHRQRDGLRVAETWSTAAGNYEFDFIDPLETYFTVGFDHTGQYRGVVADGLVPVSM